MDLTGGSAIVNVTEIIDIHGSPTELTMPRLRTFDIGQVQKT